MNLEIPRGMSVYRKYLMEKKEVDGVSSWTLERLAFLVCRGGWPQAVDMRDEIALDQAVDYYDAVVHSDINRADNVRKNAERVKWLMRSYARNQGCQVSNALITKDISMNDETQINEENVFSYIGALRKIFVVEDMPAWNPNLRLKTAIRSSDTRYYIDPSIAVAALGVGPNDLLSDLNTFGFFSKRSASETFVFFLMHWVAKSITIETKLNRNVMPSSI